MSVKSGGTWQEADNITPQVGSDGDSYPTYLSPDGKTLLLVKKIKRNSDIYISHFIRDKWSIMEPLNENINTRWNETHASMSADGKTLYIVSDRKGTIGGLDIWASPLQADGQWGKAVNLGPDINTKLDEDNPFETADGKVLFFASQGHMNMGGFDIFYSKKVDNKWSKAVNLGYPINTTTDDKFYFPLGKGIVGYMARRLSKGFGLQDIYRVSITDGDPIKDLYPDYKNEPIADNKLNISKNVKSIDSARIITDAKNEQANNVHDRLAVVPPDTLKETKHPAEPGKFTSPDKQVDLIKIDSISKSSDNLHVTGILFDFNSSAISQTSAMQLDKLADALNRCADIEINISGYADARGKEAANKIMSENRTQSVVKYLTAKGINAKRLHLFSYGSKSPIAQNSNPDGTDNPEGRKFNRRVEFKSIQTSSSCLTIDLIAIPSRLKIK
jgi:outer membrane protein OmpA-like peptidoglycan-associated protein/Tol biopolymer transport system component